MAAWDPSVLNPSYLQPLSRPGFIFISQRKKLRLRKEKEVVRGHTAAHGGIIKQAPGKNEKR